MIPPSSKILIIGALNVLGRAIANELAESGTPITVITRYPKRAIEYFPTASIIHGDLRDTESLLRQIAGFESVVLNLSLSPGTQPWQFIPERDGLQNLLECAEIAQVPHIAYTTSLLNDAQGVNQYNWWVFKVKLHAIKVLQASPIQTTLFKISTLMDIIDKGSIIKNDRIIIPATRQRGSYYISSQDAARQISTALSDPNRWGDTYFLQGPERLLPIVAAKKFAAYYPHRKLIPTLVPLWPFRLAGILNSEIHHFERAISAAQEYKETFLSENTWAQLGAPKTTLATYAEYYADPI